MWERLWRAAPPTEDIVPANAALLIGRVLVVLGLLPNGMRKIATFAQTAAGMGGEPQVIGGRAFPDQTPLVTFPVPEFFLGASVVFDLAGAVLVIIGLKTRAVALALAGYVFVAMAIFHSDIRHEMDLMHLIRNLPFLAALMILSASGGGWWSLDGLIARRAQ
jgi:putative oxidoreductase